MSIKNISNKPHFDELRRSLRDRKVVRKNFITVEMIIIKFYVIYVLKKLIFKVYSPVRSNSFQLSNLI